MFSQGGEARLEPKYLVLPLSCLISISLNTPSTSFSQYIMCPSLNKPLAFLPQMSTQLLLFLINFSSFFKIQHRHRSGKWLFPTLKVVKQIRAQVWESQSFNLTLPLTMAVWPWTSCFAYLSFKSSSASESGYIKQIMYFHCLAYAWY